MEPNGTKKRAIFVIILCTLIITISQLFWKTGVEKIVVGNFLSFFNTPMLIGVVLYGISSFLVLYALKHGELSVVYPILATSYVWISIIAPIMFHETVKITNIFGVTIIILGISLLGRGIQKNG
jgi:multidrug transporter EmrE-like cation transporter